MRAARATPPARGPQSLSSILGGRRRRLLRTSYYHSSGHSASSASTPTYFNCGDGQADAAYNLALWTQQAANGSVPCWYPVDPAFPVGAPLVTSLDPSPQDYMCDRRCAAIWGFSIFFGVMLGLTLCAAPCVLCSGNDTSAESAALAQAKAAYDAAVGGAPMPLNEPAPTDGIELVQPPYGVQPQPPYGEQPQPPYGMQPPSPYGVQPQPPYGMQPPSPYGEQPQQAYGMPRPYPAPYSGSGAVTRY